MSDSATSLESKIQSIRGKAGAYETATNYEATREQYLGNLSSVESSLGQLARRMEAMEFVASVLTDVLGESLPMEVEDARRSAVSIADRDKEDFWKLVDEGRTDQYEQKVQQAVSEVNSAKDAIEDELREVESEWTSTIASAREVQNLVGKSKERTRVLNEIHNFVTRRMWDSSNGIPTLSHEWNDLQDDWQRVKIDWDEFQARHGLSDETIGILQDLAEGEDAELTRLNDDIAEEILSVEELRNVLKLTI